MEGQMTGGSFPGESCLEAGMAVALPCSVFIELEKGDRCGNLFLGPWPGLVLGASASRGRLRGNPGPGWSNTRDAWVTQK